jgi:hypothetical protein
MLKLGSGTVQKPALTTSKDWAMRCAPRRTYITAGVVIAGASLIAVTPVAPATPDVQVRAVRLTSGDSADSPLGDGTALIMGGSGIPIPPQTYLDAADTLYLQPRDFTARGKRCSRLKGSIRLPASTA